VLRDQPGPPGGEEFVAGVTRPTWVIQVSEPLAPEATSPDQLAPPDSRFRDARRVIVTVNGGGTADGAGGGTNQISITAGGTRRSTIPANSLQGVPSFVEARSRCGGSMVLVVDESNSITNTYIGQVRAAVQGFIEILAGTPVRLQVVRFHTRASVLGDGAAWTRYYDLSEPAEVAALLAAVPNLQGSWPSSPERNGGTNWEDALFRTFYSPNGQLQQNLPDTVVFFTDGVPTYSRLDDPLYPATVTRGAPGILTNDPPPPAPGWPLASGTAYNQVSFNRANHIATKFRSSVKLIGVGVGPDINKTSQWMSDPGVGYHVVLERGSRTYQRAGSWTPQSTWQVRNSGSSSWYNTTKQVYDGWNPTRRRIQWGNISQSMFAANNSSATADDGYRRVSLGSWSWVSTAEYQAALSTLDADLYRVQPKEWSAGPDWEPWTGPQEGSASHYRSTKVYAPPYTHYEAPVVTANLRNDVILARLIAGNDTGVPAVWDGVRYTNPEVADMYVSPNWSQLAKALQAVALGECGGTLTVQTRINGTSPAPDPFTYQNVLVRDSTGAPMLVEPTVVRTNQQFTAGTFDFEIPNGQFVDVDVAPLNLSDLVGYAPVGWSCRAGMNNRAVEAVPIEGSPWTGMRVRVAANEAVSCTLTVNKL
jgi:hypothetical protein